MSGRLGRVTRIQHDLQTQPPDVVCAHGDRQIRAEKDLDGSSHRHARSQAPRAHRPKARYSNHRIEAVRMSITTVVADA